MFVEHFQFFTCTFLPFGSPTENVKSEDVDVRKQKSSLKNVILVTNKRVAVAKGTWNHHKVIPYTYE